MRIDKAIEILTLDKAMEFEGDLRDLEDALQIGIEALKRIQAQRVGLPVSRWFTLPGETEE